MSSPAPNAHRAVARTYAHASCAEDFSSGIAASAQQHAAGGGTRDFGGLEVGPSFERCNGAGAFVLRPPFSARDALPLPTPFVGRGIAQLDDNCPMSG